MNIAAIVAAAVGVIGLLVLVGLAARRYRLGEKWKERSDRRGDELDEANEALRRRSKPLDLRSLGRRLRRAAKRRD